MQRKTVQNVVKAKSAEALVASGRVEAIVEYQVLRILNTNKMYSKTLYSIFH